MGIPFKCFIVETSGGPGIYWIRKYSAAGNYFPASEISKDVLHKQK